MFTNPPPLALYIHLPWCVQKCPYCDFNSHKMKDSLPEVAYVAALLDELNQRKELIGSREIISIFMGGGTPSLFSGQSIGKLLEGIDQTLNLANDIEITLEANPGTIETTRFKDFFATGVNRISLGVQSFQDDKLKRLGRIHDAAQAKYAIKSAIKAGFKKINLDLMFGLPDQTIDDALYDLETALAFEQTHQSWYQLTLEPNTLFHHMPPTLPPDDEIWKMQCAGNDALAVHGFKQYEVSAFARDDHQCRHNLNYWKYGDYLGIGAGAHSKITNAEDNTIVRFANVKHPKDYLTKEKRDAIKLNKLKESDLPFEYMLNALRLTDGFNETLFTDHTGLPFEHVKYLIEKAVYRKFVTYESGHIQPTALGNRFLNNLMTMFLMG